MALTSRLNLIRRKRRVRGKIYGTPERPRLSLFISNRYLFAQVIDDTRGFTIASIYSKKENVPATISGAQTLGQKLAERALNENIRSVVFDRNGRLYHGKVKAFASSARDSGLSF